MLISSLCEEVLGGGGWGGGFVREGLGFRLDLFWSGRRDVDVFDICISNWKMLEGFESSVDWSAVVVRS
jgi:hypothetical protein